MLRIPLKYIKIYIGKQKDSTKKNIVLLQGINPSDNITYFFIENLLQRIKQEISKEEIFLLSNFNILIFPVINLDGVLFGNSLNSLSGQNLLSPSQISKHTTPEIFYLTKHLQKLSQEHQISMLINFTQTLSKQPKKNKSFHMTFGPTKTDPKHLRASNSILRSLQQFQYQ